MGPRQRLLEAADRLFYERGLTATGVDAICAEAGVAKMSLYHHFGSKDGLVAAYLEERDARWRERLRADHASDPLGRVAALIDAYYQRASAPDSRGCSFLNAAAELPGADHPARTVIARHKQTTRERLRTDLQAAGAEDSLADELFTLLEGMLAVGALDPNDAGLDAARALAHRRLEHLPVTSTEG